MRKALSLFVVTVGLLIGITASASVNAGPTWNQFAPGYNFQGYPQSGSTTFEQAYYGDNFEADFAGIVSQVSKAMNIRVPIGGDDLLNISLENWGSGSDL